MNAAITSYLDQDIDYQIDFRRREETDRPQRTNSPRYSRRRGKRPQSVNGIHRRRARRIRW